MIDLDTELRTSLQSYAQTITPSPPEDLADITARNSSPTPAPRTRAGSRWLVAAAAAVMIAGLVPALVLLRDDSSSTTTPPPTASPRQGFGSWQTVVDAPLSPRKTPSIVWTGDEFLGWGGSDGNPHPLADGAAFDPSTATWRPIAAPSGAHPGANAVWAGDRMVVLAGAGGEAYDPETDSWSSLPSLDLEGDEVGFTDAVWTDGVLLGIGVKIADDGNRAILDVWTLDPNAGEWVDREQITITSGIPTTGRHVSVDDQFIVYNPVPTDDGFVLWNTFEGGWRFRLGDGWSRLPALVAPFGTVIGDATAVWVTDRLVAVVHIGAADQDSIEISELGADGWSPLRSVGSGWIGFPQATAVNGQIVVLGINSDPSSSPLLIDPDATTLVLLQGYPIETTFEQGAAWSGSQLFVWGGQTPTDDAESSTSDPGPISNQGAIWQP